MNRRSRSTRTCVSLCIDRQVAKHRPKCRSTRTCVQNRCIRALPNSEAKVRKNREPRSKTFECQADNTVFFGTYPFFCHIQTTIQAYSAETNTRCPTPRTPASEVIPHPSPGPATPALQAAKARGRTASGISVISFRRGIIKGSRQLSEGEPLEFKFPAILHDTHVTGKVRSCRMLLQ